MHVTRDMGSRDQELVAGGMRNMGNFFRRRVVRGVRNIIVTLERESRRWHCLSNVILGWKPLPSHVPVGSTAFSLRPTVVSWRKSRLTLVALGCAGGGGHIDVLN